MPEFHENELALRKFVSPEIIYGAGARSLAGQYTAKLGLRHVLVVSDPGVAAAGWTEDVCRLLSESDITYDIFLKVSVNPRDTEVMQGGELYTRAACDGIVALGGGSAMDCAKAIGVSVRHDQHINLFEGVDKLRVSPPPLLCIPTTAGSASEVSQFSIITNTKVKKKIAIAAKGLVPDVALIDPEICLTLPESVSSSSGIDVLVHACEAFVSTANSPLTDMHAIAAARLVVRYLPLVLAEPDNIMYRSCMLRASMEAGFAFSNAILGAVHATAHALGGYYDAVHGVCNGILMPAVTALNWRSAEGRYRQFAEAIGWKLPAASTAGKTYLFDCMEGFAASVRNPPSFSAIGIADPACDLLADFALVDPCMITNPCKPSRAEVIELYESRI